MPHLRRASRLAFCVQRAAPAEWLPGDAKLRAWAANALLDDADVTLRLIGEEEARALNRVYRGRGYATNVLTFAYPDFEVLTGDIAICVPVVEREAQAQAKAREAHLAHLLVHGVLHLQGFDHERRLDAELMEGIESEIVIKLGYPDPYGQR
jgi:probable rRNA maturation factor